MRRRLTLVVWACLALCALVVPAGALADGDPGSDELVYQDLFYGAQDNLSVAQQTQLGHLLDATIVLHAPVRVAIIGQRADLGAITQLWGEPAAYAEYLGTELELAYSGRLIVVMPQGVAFSWYRHGAEALSGIRTGASPTQLVAAADAAVAKVEAATAGIRPAKLTRTAASKSVAAAAAAAAGQSPTAAIASTGPPAAGGEPRATSSATDVSPVIVVLGLLVVLGAVFWWPPLWRRRGVLRQGGIALPGLALGLGALGALAVLAVVIHSSDSSTGLDAAQATNPDLAAVNLLEPRLAPNFTLTDETGHTVSLSQYRGKAVILSFTDDECQTICPLTTQAMVDARDALGAAKRDVQLLGVDANARSTSIFDVLSYTELHGLLGQWHFLTGDDAQLARIWREYGISDDLSSGSSIIDHTPAIWIIGPDGRVRATSVTYASYASIPQYGQELAQEVSRILPSHPQVQTHLSYGEIRGISASTRTTLPKVGGGIVTLGTGTPHLYLFFATWDEQSTAIRAKMEQLNAYARAASRLGLPPLTAIDEGSVEPNPEALGRFLTGMHLDYPVAVDTTGQVADGYGVQGEPWFVLGVPGARNTVVDPTATTPWAQEVYTQGWPGIGTLETSIPAALKPPTVSGGAAAVARDLAGSPPALGSLHAQSSELLGGGASALLARLATLKGHPVVINVWASDCGPCQREFGFFAAASARYGSKVAFVGIDYEDASSTAARGFLDRHRVSYPSYGLGDADVPGVILPGGVESTPMTIIFTAQGRRAYVQDGEYQSEQQLAEQIQAYALGSPS